LKYSSISALRNSSIINLSLNSKITGRVVTTHSCLPKIPTKVIDTQITRISKFRPASKISQSKMSTFKDKEKEKKNEEMNALVEKFAKLA
jgi:hypothetical protein